MFVSDNLEDYDLKLRYIVPFAIFANQSLDQLFHVIGMYGSICYDGLYKLII